MTDDLNPLADTLAGEVRGLLAMNPQGLTSHDLLKKSEFAQDITDVGNVLYALRKRGEATRDDRGRHALTGKQTLARRAKPRSDEESKPAELKSATAHEATGSAPCIAVEPLPEHRNAATMAELRTLLEDNARNAQNALDRYVWLVGDKRILEHLMTQRDAARALLDSLDEHK